MFQATTLGHRRLVDASCEQPGELPVASTKSANCIVGSMQVREDARRALAVSSTLGQSLIRESQWPIGVLHQNRLILNRRLIGSKRASSRVRLIEILIEDRSLRKFADFLHGETEEGRLSHCIRIVQFTRTDLCPAVDLGDHQRARPLKPKGPRTVHTVMALQ